MCIPSSFCYEFQEVRQLRNKVRYMCEANPPVATHYYYCYSNKTRNGARALSQLRQSFEGVVMCSVKLFILLFVVQTFANEDSPVLIGKMMIKIKRRDTNGRVKLARK